MLHLRVEGGKRTMPSSRLFPLSFAVSGAAALIYVVSSPCLLTLPLRNGVRAASTVLAAFMGGLAIGSAVGGHLVRRIAPRRAVRVYAVVEIAIAALALLLPLELAALRPWLAATYGDGNPGLPFPLFRLA